jgi:FAD/FMN-containing dehydrogenase
VHNLKGITYSPSFTPAGCPTTITYPAITVGAGSSWQDVYEFADQNNLTAVGGYHQTIAASGGWVMVKNCQQTLQQTLIFVQGGGHSILSPVYGLGVDRVREFKIVTPDGQYRVANECENQDLFWALRGGGGSTFGVVLESSHIVEPTSLALQVYVAASTRDQISSRSRRYRAFIKHSGNTTVQASWLELLVENALKWGTEGWGGHMTASQRSRLNILLIDGARFR